MPIVRVCGRSPLTVNARTARDTSVDCENPDDVQDDEGGNRTLLLIRSCAENKDEPGADGLSNKIRLHRINELRLQRPRGVDLLIRAKTARYRT